MTPKEKAKELLLKFYVPQYCFAKAGMPSDWRRNLSKETALTAVEEMIKQQEEQFKDMHWSCVNYWKEVRNEIENL